MLFLLVGCGLPDRLLVFDADDDGYTANEGDCDDGDDSVSPEGVETCDGKDNDCDGSIDLAACRSWEPSDDEGQSVMGESGLGETLALGLLDGDTRPDLIAYGSLGSSRAACLVPGARLGGEADQPLSEVATCWITAPGLYPPVVVSAARYGSAVAPGQEVAFVGGRDSVCLIDPFGSGYTLDLAAERCITAEELTDEDVRPLGYAAADHAGGTVALWSEQGVAVLDPVYYLEGGQEADGWAVEAEERVRAMAGGRDITGDGVGDLLLAEAEEVWIISGDAGISAPVALLGEAVPVEEAPSAVGFAGDVDGDGLGEWWAQGNAAACVYRFDSEVSRLTGVDGRVTPVGDFNGDGPDDLFFHFEDAGTPGVAGLLGGPWPVELYVRLDADLVSFKAEGDFGAAIVGGGDYGADGRTDPWISAPTMTYDGVLRGKLYRVEGWPITAALGRD